jgi:hypothetical protein
MLLARPHFASYNTGETAVGSITHGERCLTLFREILQRITLLYKWECVLSVWNQSVSHPHALNSRDFQLVYGAALALASRSELSRFSFSV